MSNDFKTELPDSVLDFLSDVEAVRFAEGFVKKYGLKDEDVSTVMSLLEEVVYGNVAIVDLPTEIVSQLGIEESKSVQAAIELAKTRLLPIQEVVPRLGEQILVWSGTQRTESSSETSDLTPELFVQTALQTVVNEMPGYLQSRFTNILEQYVAKEFDREGAVDMLMRSEKVGGVEFEKEDAEELLNFVDEKMKGKIIVGAGLALPAGRQVPAHVDEIPVGTSRDLSTTAPVTTAPKRVEPVRNDHEDAQDIAQIKTEKQSVMETPITAEMTIEQMVGQICSFGPMKFDDSKLNDRCKQIVETRLREVRSASDTQAQIERPVESGGLGVQGRKLADMVQVIEKGVDVLLKRAADKIEQDRVLYVEKKQTEQARKESLAEKEAQIMTKRYVSLTGKMPEDHISPASPSLSRVSAALSKEDAVQNRMQQVDTAKVRSVIEATKQIQTLSPALSLKGRGGTQRPFVQDVTFVKRLSGPIDELRAMTLVDFRRMAKDPLQAVQKMIDQVQMVEEEGYEKRVEAIRAWQSSPLCKQYLDLTRKALQEGKPLEDVRKELEKSGSTLTKEELAALIQLNRELRF